MSDKIFVDTNILVYFYTKTEIAKFDVLNKALSDASIVISTQVLSEFSNVLLKKFKISPATIDNAIQEFCAWCSIFVVEKETIRRALLLIKAHKLSYYDALIVAAALDSNCKFLYSEDMQDGYHIEKSLHIINPF